MRAARIARIVGASSLHLPVCLPGDDGAFPATMATNQRLDPSELRPVSWLEQARTRAAAALRFHPREAAALAVLGLLILTGAGIAYVRARPASASVVEPTHAVPGASISAAARIVVHVVGAIRKPGVYEFDQGARVIDAVHAAGGFARNADPAAINLARLLVDGEQIDVPAKGATAAPAAKGGAQQGGKLNVNDATVAEFDALPGIGPVLAQRIVDYRTQHGPFHSVDDLQKVTGIGPKKFASLKPYLTV